MGDLWLPIAWTIGGLAALVAGGEALVSGAVRIAAAFRVPSLLIGLTVVAIGTSLPEFAVSVQASYSGSAELAVGNFVGSNIFNVLFILGLSALIAPLQVSSQLIRRDAPLMVAASLAVLALSFDGELGRTDGLLLVAALAGYLVWTVQTGRAEAADSEEPADQETRRARPLVDALLLIVGLVLLSVGARWLVAGAADIARSFGVSELVIGLTIVAAGTSMPEVAASVSATLRGQRDVAVGNVVGSNLFNLLGVLGGAAAVSSSGLSICDEVLRFDLPVMIAAAAACLPIFFTGGEISRWEGGVFLFYFLAYTTYVVALAVNAASAQQTLEVFMLYFAAPLTVVTLAATVFAFLRASRRQGAGAQGGER